MTTLSIIGAGGNMGTRISRALERFPQKYRLLFVENGPVGLERLAASGRTPVPLRQAQEEAEVVVLAVPDRAIRRVAAEVVPGLRSGALVILLDPAAPYAGHLPPREDVAYFVTHPAHPPVFNDEVGEARRDFFGSGLAKQSIVSALVQGTEADYARGETIARDMFGPILRSHRVSLEQMVLLEPALSETVAATCITIIREAMDEAIRRGVPPEAARDFLLGHVNIPLAIVFGEIDWDFSEGAKRAIQEAKRELFQPDWKKVFEPEHLRRSVARITGEIPD
ncbi:MAG: semialdehyde dehydrogenase [Meiothermus sp.]